MSARLKDKYQQEVVPALTKEFGYKNVMAVPRIQKVVVNMGLGEATSNPKLVDVGADELARITGQKPVTRRSKKSIAAFKVRKGQPIAAMVTLRGDRMWEFLDRLMSIALPRVRDFKGVSPKGFDGRGNYTLGLRDQLLGRDVGQDRRRSAEAAPVHRHAVPAGRQRLRAMATTAKIAKELKTPKFKVRLRNRCHLCGRPRAYMRKFALCRLCFRKLALEGDITGVTKSSW